MMRSHNVTRFIATAAFGLLLGASACDKKEEAPAADPTVAKAAELAKKIEANPDGAEKALEEAGMSVDDFETLMMDIAADPAKTEAFEAAKAG